MTDRTDGRASDLPAGILGDIGRPAADIGRAADAMIPGASVLPGDAALHAPELRIAPDPRIPADLDGTLVLVRHGESTWIVEGRFQGSSDPPLSPLGERQAELVAGRLADPLAWPALPVPPGDPVACWHSPLRRAAAVAERIRDRHPASPALRADPRLREISQGEWEGVLHAEVAERDGDRYRGWRREPTRYHGPGGEDLADAAARVADAFADILRAIRAAERHDPWALVVAHDGVFRLAVLALFGLPLERFWLFPFGQCSITVIDIRGGRPMFRAHNLAAHLASLGPAPSLVKPSNPGSGEPEDRVAL
jgi:phosphoserine phosphatase